MTSLPARLRGWRRVVILAAFAGVAVSVPSACSSSGETGAPTLGEVRALLARHGAAVLDRSSNAFLRDVDTGEAAREFRDRQATQIEALADVALQSWSYSVRAPVTEPAAVDAAGQRHGAPAVVVHVELAYALRGIDPAPSVQDLWWTFVRRDGRVRLAGDDDMAELGGASWRGPWDFGPIVAARGDRSLVLGHQAEGLPALAEAADAAVPVVTDVWGSEWARRVAVLVPGSAAEFEALTGQSTALVDISAAAVFDPRDPVSDVVTGQRIVVNPSALGTLTPTGRRIVLLHEITHLATAATTGDVMPRWVVEGFAEYVGNLRSGQPVTVAAAELRADIRAGRVPDRLPSDADFAPGSVGQAQLYEQSWLACRLIATRAGEPGLARFYRLVGAGTATPDAAVESALRRVLHESTATFTSKWRAYLRTELA